MTSFRFFFWDLLQNPVTMLSVVLGTLPVLLGLVFLVINPKLFRLIVKNLGRNRLRTALTCSAIVVLVMIVTIIWSVVFFLDLITREQSSDLKVIVTERWQIPSQMPGTYGNYLNPKHAACILSDIKDSQGRPAVGPNDFMTWSFYGGTTDPSNFTVESLVFFFVMEPDQIRTMMDDLQDLDPAVIQKLKDNRRGCLLGRERLQAVGKRVGERFKLTSINYKGIDLEFEIVGELPEGRYDKSGIMNAEYFNNALDTYKAADGSKHPLDNKRLNLIWLRVPDQDTFSRVAERVENAPELGNPQVKCEMASSAIGAWLDAYSDLLRGVKWVMVPAILISMALVVANAIGISVRERYQEIAVLKVLGYRPGQVLVLVLGESLLVGGLSGLVAASATFALVNYVIGGIPFPIAFFPAFTVPIQAIWWGLATGFMTALVGSFLPAWSARSVRVSEVFSKVA
jgi:putative ABC transport system permease protein